MIWKLDPILYFQLVVTTTFQNNRCVCTHYRMIFIGICWFFFETKSNRMQYFVCGLTSIGCDYYVCLWWTTHMTTWINHHVTIHYDHLFFSLISHIWCHTLCDCIWFFFVVILKSYRCFIQTTYSFIIMIFMVVPFDTL